MMTKTSCIEHPVSASRLIRVTSYRRGRGFTLLELLVVLTVIGLSVGLIAGNLSRSDSGAFRGEIRRAVSTLTYARRAAIVQAKPQTASFHALDPESADFDDRREALETDDGQPRWLSDNLALEFQVAENEDGQPVEDIDVTFFPQGGSTGGVVTFVQDDNRARVRVDPITGRIATAYDNEPFDDAF